jgi:hypothetical protein
VAIRADTGGLVGAAAREQSRIQAALVIAQRVPRDEGKCMKKIMRSCARPTFAEKARYVYPRGGTNIEGPSVQLAREAGRIWGNLDYGYTVADRTRDHTTVEGVCWDLESNARNTASVTFKNLIYRKGKGWIEPDERDYRELTAKNGAIAVRNAILQVIPPDIVEEAMHAVRATIIDAARGTTKQDSKEATRRMVVAFRDLKVTPDMLEAKLGHPMDETTPEEIADLRAVYTSIADGHSKVSEVFATPTEDGAKPQASDIDGILPDNVDPKTGEVKE